MENEMDIDFPYHFDSRGRTAGDGPETITCAT